jgi:cellulose synthase/poly-beta-1,6-N-acetylglucosamine synthase-like glycosyltransferase
MLMMSTFMSHSQVWDDPLQMLAHVILFTCLAAILYTFLLYPLLLRVIASFRPRKCPAPEYRPTISILICAYNEAAGIAKKLDETLALDYPKERVEIIVVSDGSTDETESIVETYRTRNVRLLRTTHRLGKTNAQNEAVASCAGEVIIFSDATTVYHSQALSKLAAHFADPRVGAVSGRYQYFDESGDSPTGTGSIAFWSFENFIKTSQSRIATISGCCGCIYSVRRSAYTVLSPDIISDLVQPLYVIRKGLLVLFEEKAMAYETTTVSSQQELRMRIRVITRAIRGLLSVPDLLNPIKRPWIALQLVSHKVLRWLVPLYIIGIFLSTAVLIDRAAMGVFFLLQLCFYGTALVSLVLPLHRHIKLLGLPLYICTMNTAALLAIIESARGTKYVVWETIR